MKSHSKDAMHQAALTRAKELYALGYSKSEALAQLRSEGLSQYLKDHENTILEDMKKRLVEIETQLNEIPTWGAAVSVLGEEKRHLESRIAAEESKQE